jgi:hypothetical protein
MFKTTVFLVALSVSEHWVCATPLTKSEEFDISGNELIRNPGTALPTTYQILKNDANALHAVWVSGIAGQPIAALVVLDKTSGLLREATVSTDSRFNSGDTVTCKKTPQ